MRKISAFCVLARKNLELNKGKAFGKESAVADALRDLFRGEFAATRSMVGPVGFEPTTKRL